MTNDEMETLKHLLEKYIIREFGVLPDDLAPSFVSEAAYKVLNWTTYD